MDKQEQIAKFKEMCKFYKVDFDLLDFEAQVDSSLSFEENKEKIEQMIGTLAKQQDKIEAEKKIKKSSIKEEKREQERVLIQEIRKAEQETEKQFEKSFEYLKNNENFIIEEIFDIPINFIKAVAGNYTDSFIFLGKQGQGKSTITIQTLLKEKANFVYKQGYMTPLQLYIHLYENKDNKILVFDDVAGLISNTYSLSLILSALWSATDKRKISWNSTSGKLEIPTEGIFNSRIIFIANKIPNNEYAELVMSRCLSYEINLNYRQMILMMTEIAKLPHKRLKPEQRIEIVEFIKENTDETTKDFDLRIQRKMENLYLYSKGKWKDYALALLNKKDEKLALVKKLLLTFDYVKDMLNEWNKQTGLGRSSFFNYKGKLGLQTAPNWTKIGLKTARESPKVQ